jgi:hypothetical protein
MWRALLAISFPVIMSVDPSCVLAQTLKPSPNSQEKKFATDLRAQAPGPGAIVVPRSSCGTAWTDWVDDPEADVNPCSASCERGERQVLDSHDVGGHRQFRARYECYLPKLVINQPSGVVLNAADGAKPRRSCGTAWTSAQSDPQSSVNPCPSNCERGELQIVNRSISGKSVQYEMRYQCYVAEIASADKSKQLGDVPPKLNSTVRNINVPGLALIGAGPTPNVTVTGLTLAGAGPTSNVGVNGMSLVGSGPTPNVTVTRLTLAGTGPTPNVNVDGMSLVGSGPTTSVDVPIMTLIGSKQVHDEIISR